MTSGHAAPSTFEPRHETGHEIGGGPMGDHVELNEDKPRTLFIARSSNYAANCATGYQGNYHNAHHVVPCTAINKSLLDYLATKPYAYNKALARFTKWD